MQDPTTTNYIVFCSVADQNKNMVREYVRCETLQSAEFEAESHYLTYKDMVHLIAKAYIYEVNLVKTYDKENPDG